MKDFALPEDYTVVAMREQLGNNQTPLLAKTHIVGAGAFHFDATDAISYAHNNTISKPQLFSYQSKTSYNGTTIIAGNAIDTVDDKLFLFKTREETTYYKKAALYSFGVFNRTLTAEELALVEDCMYLELEYNTTILDNIEYYDILDARYRSNEEAKDKRNKWNGRLGKLHLTLNNYTYSQKSGWNGYPFEPFNILDYASNSDATESKVKITKLNSMGWICYLTIGASKTNEWRLRVHNPFGKKLYLIYINYSECIKLVTLNEGINVIPPATEEFTNIAFEMNHFSVGEYIEVEQLPLYPGALVSDGVNDYAVSDETIDEEIGGVVMLAEKISDPVTSYGNIFSSSAGLGDSTGKEIAGLVSKGSDTIIMGDPWTSLSKSSDAAYGLARSPIAPDNKLMLGNNKSNEWGNAALYQLRLIKTQPTDTQLEAIKWQCRKEHEDYLIHMGWKDETPAWYGVEWDVTDSSPDLKRIGNMQMHRDLPVQSQMRGCLLNDDGVVQKYLDPDDWTSETLDGSAGQVMVHAPVDSYWRFEKDGNIRRVKLATTALPGFKRTPQGFLGSEEATVQRSTNKLCSVVNEDADYRGGNNNSAWDGTYRSLLGMPATAISRTNFRTYARNRKPGSTEWNCMTYDFQKLLYWLFVVEYATLNTQKTVNTEKDASGFSQGGLGNGVTTWDWAAWSNHNGNHPLIPCGVTNKLGNNSGEVAFQITLSDNTNKEFKVARYRGVENPFGHVWQWTDGLNFRISANTSAGGDGLSRIFTCSDPAKFSDTGYDGYKYIGDAPRANGYMKDIVFGEDGDIVPISTGGSATTYFCNYWYTSIPDSGESLRGVLFSGYASSGANVGLASADSYNAPSATAASVGSRLCFIPSGGTDA